MLHATVAMPSAMPHARCQYECSCPNLWAAIPRRGAQVRSGEVAAFNYARSLTRINVENILKEAGLPGKHQGLNQGSHYNSSPRHRLHFRRQEPMAPLR